MAPLSEFIWAEEERRSGLPESAIREAYSPVLPRREKALEPPHPRFPKDVINVMFECSETADILGSRRWRRNIILRVPTGHTIPGISGHFERKSGRSLPALLIMTVHFFRKLQSCVI